MDNKNNLNPIEVEFTKIEEVNTSYNNYERNYEQKKKKKNGILAQMVVVSLVSSIIGGATVGAAYQFVLPSLQATVNKSVTPLKNAMNKSLPGEVKSVAIESSESGVVAIAEKAGKAVVGIKVSAPRSSNGWSFSDSFGFDPFGSNSDSKSQAQAQSQGSGIIIREDGYIMTNNHVIESAVANDGTTIKDAKIEVILPNEMDKPYKATIVGRDAKTDLAVLKIEASSLPAVEMGDSDKVKVGEMAVAIGNPGGLEYMGSVTVGVVSGLNRTVPVEDGKDLKLIQTDAAINPGNSGGALVNSRGQLIGVNTAKIGGDGYEGLGFAIPVNKAKEITNSLIEFKYVKGRPSIGISIDSRFNATMAKRYKVPMGLLVSEVAPLSGAAKAGIKANDIVTKADGVEVKSMDQLNDVKNKKKPGDTIKLEIYRDKSTITKEVVLGEEQP